jgi:hypothetical protein
VVFAPEEITMRAERPGGFSLVRRESPGAPALPRREIAGRRAECTYRNFSYATRLIRGFYDGATAIRPEDGQIRVAMAEKTE